MANENFKYLLQDDTGQAINTTLTALKNVIENKSTDVPAWVTAALALPTAQKTALKSAIYEVLGLNNSAQTSAQALPDIYAILDETVEETTNMNYNTGAAVHNSLFRGKNLGESLTNEQAANIANGTFKGLWVGDYWEKEMTYSYPDANNGDAITSVTRTINFRIGHFDYKYHAGSGSQRCTTHHALVTPGAILAAPMNATDTNASGYLGSKMVTFYLPYALTVIQNFFGAGHIMSYDNYYSNAVTDGYITGYASANRKIDLFSVPMLLGYRTEPLYSPTAKKGDTHDCDTKQCALFALSTQYVRAGITRDADHNGGFYFLGDTRIMYPKNATAPGNPSTFVCVC